LAETAQFQANSTGFIVVANQVKAENQKTFLLLSGQVQGNIETALDAKSAFTFGAALGAVLGLILLLRDIITRK
jgi:hypothetical protein